MADPPVDSSNLEREFGRILEESLNEIYIFDAETLRFIQVNRGARENLGLSMEELSRLTPLDIKPMLTRAEFDALALPLRNDEEKTIVFRTAHRRRDGTTYPVEVHLQLGTFHKIPAFIAIVLDTTESDRTAEDIRVRNRAIESVSAGVVISDALADDMPIVFCNQAFERITGYHASEVLGRNCRFLQEDDRDQEAREVIRKALGSKRECRVLLRNYRKSGEMFWNELLISPVKDPQGKLTHYVGLVNDLTDRIRANEEKFEREARLSAILNTAVEAIITIDEQGICESLNPAAERMFGYQAEEIVGLNISLLMPSPYREEHNRYLESYLRTGKKKIIGIGREVIGRRKNGEEFPMELSVSEVQLKEKRLFTGLLRDLTDLKQAQRKLIQSERLAALGEATARLAHEGRNSLQRIQIAVETARLHSDEQPLLQDQLNAIEKASDGLHALLEELRNFAAPVQLQATEVSLPSIWREAWQATTALQVGREAELVEKLSTESIICRADRFRLGQVFRNLFENSLVACDRRVKVTISVSETFNSSGNYWTIGVRDNGPGLNDEQSRRIFEPFFTTKAKGTGLGMAIAQRIIEAHEGTIKVVPKAPGGSQEVQGAEIVIQLPR